MSAERRGPAICNVSNIGEGKDEMTKASIDLQDLRRRIYVKAKAEPSWRFWGLYVHVCKMETLRAAYEMAKRNDGAPGIDGVTFEAIEAQGVEALLEQLRDELIGRTYQPLPARRQEIPKDGGKVRVLSIPAIRERVVQGALKLILEPVFEADFQPGSFGLFPVITHETNRGTSRREDFWFIVAPMRKSGGLPEGEFLCLSEPERSEEKEKTRAEKSAGKKSAEGHSA